MSFNEGSVDNQCVQSNFSAEVISSSHPILLRHKFCIMAFALKVTGATYPRGLNMVLATDKIPRLERVFFPRVSR